MIIQKETDSIVNATNMYMIGGSGICGVIYKVAEYEVEMSIKTLKEFLILYMDSNSKKEEKKNV